MNASQFHEKLVSLQEHMLNFALSLTFNKDDAKDLAQDTTLRALRNQEKFVTNVNFKAWVFTIMHHIFINDRNKMIRLQTKIDQNADLYNLYAENDSGQVSPDSLCQIKEIVSKIEQLNEDLKLPFCLHLKGYQYNEIAEKMHIPIGTVKNHIYRARQELQKELEDNI